MNNTDHAQFDVVVVPDFSAPENAAKFEARLLLFLAAWLESPNRGVLPLHIACIGSPPDTISRLARQCGASISVHSPLYILDRAYANKLRGLEIQPTATQFLLLDVDTIVLQSLSGLNGYVGRICAAPNLKVRVSHEHWKLVYTHLGMKAPDRNMQALAVELGMPTENHWRATSRYYNTGVLFAPWDCGLRELWEQRIRSIVTMCDELGIRDRALVASDQAAFATCAVSLEEAGVSFTRLPDRYHILMNHLNQARWHFDKTAIFHLVTVFSRLNSTGKMRGALRDYMRRTRPATTRLFYSNQTRKKRFTPVFTAVRERRKLYLRMKYLYEKHIAPVLPGH